MKSSASWLRLCPNSWCRVLWTTSRTSAGSFEQMQQAGGSLMAMTKKKDNKVAPEPGNEEGKGSVAEGKDAVKTDVADRRIRGWLLCPEGYQLEAQERSTASSTPTSAAVGRRRHKSRQQIE